MNTILNCEFQPMSELKSSKIRKVLKNFNRGILNRTEAYYMIEDISQCELDEVQIMDLLDENAPE